MAQKIIPVSLRLQKNQNWNSEWFVEKNEYSNYLHFDLSIKKYIKTLLEQNFKIIIKKNSDVDLVYVYFLKQSNKNIILKKDIEIKLNKIFNKKIKIFFIQLDIYFLKQKKQFVRFLQVLKKKKQFIPDLKLYKIIFFTKNISLLTTLIAKGLEKTPKHQRYIKNIHNILNFFFKNYSGFKGYKIQFKGRLNGKERSNKKIIQEGSIPLNTLKHNILYSFKEALTPYGVCSIKVWLFIDNK